MNLRKRFTLWYIRKGYRFGYDGGNVSPVAVWYCPWYIKPLLFLFSPSIYFHIESKSFLDGFLEGVLRGETKECEKQ